MSFFLSRHSARDLYPRRMAATGIKAVVASPSNYCFLSSAPGNAIRNMARMRSISYLLPRS